jgi:hypothetical protein
MAATLTPDKPLNTRQALFAQALACGMSQRDAAKAAGYKTWKVAWTLLKKPNVERRVAELMAETAAANRLTCDTVTENVREIAERNQRAESVSAQNLSRQSWMNLARMHGFMGPKPAAPAPPAREPITEIRRLIVYPDGYATDYNGNPLDPDRPPYDPSFRYRAADPAE